MDNGQTAPVTPVMTTDKALDMMMRILPDVAVIMNDTEAEGMLTRLRSAEAGNVETGDAMNCLIPLFAGKYRKNLYNILAAVTGCAVEDVGKQDITKSMLAIMNGLKVTMGFFGCCLHMVRNM